MDGRCDNNVSGGKLTPLKKMNGGSYVRNIS
jgi:hypothetical protein